MPGDQVTLAGGQAASVGDIILTRRNDRRLALTPTDFVKNGDRWTVEYVGPDGVLDVRNLRLGTRITLPSGYVRGAVELGCAATIHAAQGITTDTAHTVLSGEETASCNWIKIWNQDPKPFAWTKTAEEILDSSPDISHGLLAQHTG
jgi:hypothetical protein